MAAPVGRNTRRLMMNVKLMEDCEDYNMQGLTGQRLMCVDIRNDGGLVLVWFGLVCG